MAMAAVSTRQKFCQIHFQFFDSKNPADSLKILCLQAVWTLTPSTTPSMTTYLPHPLSPTNLFAQSPRPTGENPRARSDARLD
jgi:hypothetical protein